MGHHDLRHDKECQNCGHTVEVEYCSKCGQQNTETRQSFHHLITHTIEDITHYDGNFWKTIKYLLFRPGKLTSEYLMGHRMRFVPPVKLYIFISFVCFFIMALMAPDAEEDEKHDAKAVVHKTETKKTHAIVETDTTKTIRVGGYYNADKLNESNIKVQEKDSVIWVNDVPVYTIHQLDSLQESLPEGRKIPLLQYYWRKVQIKTNSDELSGRDMIIALAHTLPKVLFIYMPLFAFWLWLFHGKRRWYFFDHGIFTLHYFSFLLLVVTINMILSWLGSLSDNSILEFISEWVTGLIGVGSLLYPIFYFFRSHSRFYGETKTISRLKSFILFLINVILISISTIITLGYIVLNTH